LRDRKYRLEGKEYVFQDGDTSRPSVTIIEVYPAHAETYWIAPIEVRDAKIACFA